MGRIYDYTVKLAKDNDVELSDTDIGIIEKNSGSTISNLENYLNAQKHIFEKVA